MTNNAQLLPLPQLTEDELELIHYNPNTDDVVLFIFDYAAKYALPGLEAAKPADALIEALRFYAEVNNWQSSSTGFALQYDPKPAPIGKDFGHLAREALAAYEAAQGEKE